MYALKMRRGQLGKVSNLKSEISSGVKNQSEIHIDSNEVLRSKVNTEGDSMYKLFLSILCKRIPKETPLDYTIFVVDVYCTYYESQSSRNIR